MSLHSMLKSCIDMSFVSGSSKKDQVITVLTGIVRMRVHFKTQEKHKVIGLPLPPNTVNIVSMKNIENG